MGRVLALDYGSARCGVAISDPTGTLATPLEVIERPGTKKGMTRVVELVIEREASRVVVGLPIGLSGHDTDQTRECREFAANLQRRLGKKIPVELEDERFTTALAQRDIDPVAAEDSRAAAHLLEGWLSRVQRS
ncbi:MAG: Holliday junction resolvase RuvX [Solirubrobacteraceae bacterium]|nr:Holliday junction resolvase RuvX [Solirubrobacteraceae bacterium]